VNHCFILLGTADSDMTHLRVMTCSYLSPTTMTRGLLQTKAIYNGEIRNTAEYLNTEYK